MRRFLLTLGLVILVAGPLVAQVPVTYTFAAGEVISAAKINKNFDDLATGALAAGGGALTGNLDVSANVTIDGVDISDFLSPTGYVFATTAGTAANPAFAYTTWSDTGIYFPADGQVAMSLNSVQKFLLDASGLTIHGTTLVNSAGKIPAITSTYFDSLAFDAANLTGTVPLASLSGITTSQMASANVSQFTNDSGYLTSSSAIPAGMVGFFNLAACPSGWSELTAARGRYLVGLPSGGTLTGTAGTALSDLENRASGQHTHSVTDPGHTHGGTANAGSSKADNDAPMLDTINNFNRSTSSATTGISIANSGSVAGTNAPYVQLLVCQKS